MTFQNVPRLVGLTPRFAAIAWGVFVVITTVLMLRTPDSATLWQNWLAWAVIITAAALGVWRMPQTVPASVAWTVAALCVAASFQPFWDAVDHTGPFSPWYLRAITEVCALLVLRGRPLAGWVGSLLTCAVLMLSTSGDSVLVVRQLANMLGVQVLVFALGRAARAIATLRDEERIRVERDETREVAVATRRTELAAIRARAEPLLRRIASGRTSVTVRREAATLEAELRDLLRGRRLAAEPLAAAARAARSRGIDVVLLDDLDAPLSDAGGTAARTWAASRLLAAGGERATIRLSALGVTFLAGDSAEPELLELA